MHCVFHPLPLLLHPLGRQQGRPQALVAFKMNGEIVVLLPEKHELPGSNHPLSIQREMAFRDTAFCLADFQWLENKMCEDR